MVEHVTPDGHVFDLDKPETWQGEALSTCTIRKENGAPKVELRIYGPMNVLDGTIRWREHCSFELHTPHVERETPRNILVKIEGRDNIELEDVVTNYEVVIINKSGVCTSNPPPSACGLVGFVIAALCTMCWQAR